MKHIQRLGTARFAPNRQIVGQVACQFVSKLSISRKFPHQQDTAGYVWLLCSFLERNSEVTVREAEGSSPFFFKLPEAVLNEDNLREEASKYIECWRIRYSANKQTRKCSGKERGQRYARSYASRDRGKCNSDHTLECRNFTWTPSPRILVLFLK